MTDILATSPRFSAREEDVLGLLIGGGTYWAIARQLGISPHTVDTYLRRLRVKTGTANRTQLVVLALQQGYATRTAPGCEEQHPAHHPRGQAGGTSV